MDKSYNRNVPAWQGKENFKMTQNQWLVYFWFISNSKRNPDDFDHHYYLYYTDVQKAIILKETGIKSYATLNKVLEILEKHNLVIKDEIHEAYLIYVLPPFVLLDVNIIKTFFRFNQYLDIALMLRIYSILVKWKRGCDTNHSQAKFTMSSLARTLQVDSRTLTIEALIIMFGIWNMMELVKIDTKKITNAMGTTYNSYTLIDIKTTMKDEYYIDEEKIPDFWEKVALYNPFKECILSVKTLT